ncbi:hypothetical protein FA13DRAFT_701517 [Coprinellus micaceus]|uniref:Uncharacterized protein n=1 Tax=Coprinellus micaceus TaxID=71717 RepID=A0A4Y7S8M0_COPMI|nr:hypothetical protein FA13DRAFT_701517 [Coprinellus micaceus]
MLALGQRQLEGGELGLVAFDSSLDSFDGTTNSLAVSAGGNFASTLGQGQGDVVALGGGNEAVPASKDEGKDMGWDVADADGSTGGPGGDDAFETLESFEHQGLRASERDGDGGLLLFFIKRRRGLARDGAIAGWGQGLALGNVNANASLIPDLFQSRA